MSDKKPLDETWAVTAHGGVGDANGPPHLWIGGFVQSGGSALRPDSTDIARARLAAAAPDLARALLSVEWEDYSGRCPWCSAIRGADHRADCERQSALKKAGVIE